MADDARSGILGTIRRAVEGQRDEAAARAAVADRLARHARNVIPLRAQLPPPSRSSCSSAWPRRWAPRWNW
ncbi:hypothetical protein HHL28_00380 [Aerophototrophica crusticola]|uniref:Uncharacterized protein n=1 Tax=Aerophototrophica crusticola TaxID=1709002 RepID=A0A858R3J5_9PROT|nr:hypothetical protein HHL28_00380 [Rhodospirillaceae bacterium B3]